MRTIIDTSQLFFYFCFVTSETSNDFIDFHFIFISFLNFKYYYYSINCEKDGPDELKVLTQDCQDIQCFTDFLPEDGCKINISEFLIFLSFGNRRTFAK